MKMNCPAASRGVSSTDFIELTAASCRDLDPIKIKIAR
jgi:hypothetical protein